MSFKKIGVVVKPLGLEGKLIIRLEGVERDFLCSLKYIYWGKGSAPEEVSEIVHFTMLSKKSILKLKEVTTREMAESMRQANLFVPSEILPLDEKTQKPYLAYEGYQIVDEKGHFLGKVLRLESYPAQEMLIIKKDSEEKLIPFIKDFLIKVDQEKKELVMALPEGLLDED
ncbi:MAG: ribosome maturation factor RimM [Candidatus Marinimicrobia bacterium]|nr:ribosome maturation factor RimM [Candidatus Neomarinimicrobiota bacterium]MDD5583036.1 ribosome maturation factor RimM [Candidatus Neomarinimicrobiota bacterium]